MQFKVRRLLKADLIIVLLLLVLPPAFLIVEAVRGRISLSKYRRELAARGEAVTAQDFLKSPLQGENGAPEVLAAGRALVAGPVLPGQFPPRMQLTLSGSAIVGFRLDDWVEQGTNYSWSEAAADLRTNQLTLDRIRSALAKPVLDNRLDYSQGPTLLLPHLLVAKQLASWFGASCQLALREQRLEDAVDALVSQAHLMRFLSRDRILISELVRIAIGSISRSYFWEALQADGWTDPQLARLQKAWEGESLLSGLRSGLEGERVFSSITFDMCRRSNQFAVSVMTSPQDFMGGVATQEPEWQKQLKSLPGVEPIAEFLTEEVYTRIWRFAWLDQGERRYLQDVQRLVEITRSAEKERSIAATVPQIDAFLKELNNMGRYDRIRFQFSLMSINSLSGALKRALRAETERSMVIAAIALKRYAIANGKPPASLDAIVPQFLPELPVDFVDGKPLRYSLRPDGTALLYSVGDDGIDDHGDNKPAQGPSATGAPWSRNDVVWPAPASAVEIKLLRAAEETRRLRGTTFLPEALERVRSKDNPK